MNQKRTVISWSPWKFTILYVMLRTLYLPVAFAALLVLPAVVMLWSMTSCVKVGGA